MNNTFKVLGIATSLVVAAPSCSPSGADSQTSTSAADTTKLAPVETRAPNTTYKPALQGQTRSPAVKPTTTFEEEVLSAGLERPWGITRLPDGRLLITEKGGTMRIAPADGTLSAAITGLPRVNDAGQGGLLGVTID